MSTVSAYTKPDSSTRTLRADLSEVKMDAAVLRDDVIDTGRHLAAAARDRGGQAVEAVRARAASAASAVRHRSAEGIEEVQLRIMERPLTSIALGLGAGILLGIVLGRRTL